MENTNGRILIVDDEEDICEILKFNLETEGYIIDVAHSAEEALMLPLKCYQLVLLDVMMGEISGFEMAKRVKVDEATRHIPIIFLTARDTENDTITGFNLGADDYIAKPFSIREVILRVRAVLKRTQNLVPIATETAVNIINYEGLELNLDKKLVHIDGVEVAFTKTEFELLQLLMENKGKVFSRQELLDRIWSKDVLVLERTVDVYITRLRKKVDAYAQCIATRLGYGYYFKV